MKFGNVEFDAWSPSSVIPISVLMTTILLLVPVVDVVAKRIISIGFVILFFKYGAVMTNVALLMSCVGGIYHICYECILNSSLNCFSHCPLAIAVKGFLKIFQKLLEVCPIILWSRCHWDPRSKTQVESYLKSLTNGAKVTIVAAVAVNSQNTRYLSIL